jgi:hypothetical protein
MAIVLLFILGYLVSAPWIFVTQVVTLGRLAPERSLAERLQIVVAGEVLALVPGSLLANLLVGGSLQMLGAMGIPPFSGWLEAGPDLSSVWIAVPVLLTWLAVWWLLASTLKAMFMKRSWTLPDYPWALARRVSARAYAGTALALVPFLLFP